MIDKAASVSTTNSVRWVVRTVASVNRGGRSPASPVGGVTDPGDAGDAGDHPAQPELGTSAETGDDYERFERQGIPASRVPLVVKEWRTPRHPEFRAAGKTAWRLMNAFSEAWKGASLDRLPRRSQCLHGLLDLACGLTVLAA
jgi:hypothetical protein